MFYKILNVLDNECYVLFIFFKFLFKFEIEIYIGIAE